MSRRHHQVLFGSRLLCSSPGQVSEIIKAEGLLSAMIMADSDAYLWKVRLRDRQLCLKYLYSFAGGVNIRACSLIESIGSRNVKRGIAD